MLNLKHTYTIFTSLLFSIISFAQSDYKIKIIDIDTNEAIPNAQVINTQTQDTLYTDINGYVETKNTGEYIFRKIGYTEKHFNIQNLNTVIQLSINPSELSEVVITSNLISKRLKTFYSSTEIINKKEISQGNSVDFAPILNKIPGIFMQNGTLNTNRIIIRGIGSRNLYGTSKIRAYFKNIPLTNGNGETTIEDFELGSLARIEIIKGANSSIHGAGLGGTINLIPETALLNQSKIQNTMTVGSFGLFKNLINVTYGGAKTNVNTVYSHTQSDGYRENNRYNRQTFTFNSNHYLNKNNDISFLGSFVKLKGYIPSSINKETFLNNPTSAAPTWAQSKGFEDTKRSVFGFTWKHQFTHSISHSTSIFTSLKKAYEPRPFNILSENLFATGIRSRLIQDTKNLKWTLGGEYFQDFYIFKTFENLYKDYPPGTGSIQGNTLSNFKEKRHYFNIFFESDYHVTLKTIISFGINYNKTGYNIIDRFNKEPNMNQSGSYKFKNILSPTFGFSHIVSNSLNLYSNISHGFSPPTTTETLLPDGLINQNIKPETGWNFEIGTRMKGLNNRLQCNISLYRLLIKNLLVAKRIGDDEYIGINAGKTQHDGLELSANYQFLKDKRMQLQGHINYSFNNYFFKDYKDNINDYSGNDLTGVPKHIYNMGIDCNTTFGLYGLVNFQYIGSMPITDSNSVYSEAYSLSNFKIGWRKILNKKLKYNVFLGINNIFDKTYASQILINASGFNGSQPRYYYPGNPLNYFSGIIFTYNVY